MKIIEFDKKSDLEQFTNAGLTKEEWLEINILNNALRKLKKNELVCLNRMFMGLFYEFCEKNKIKVSEDLLQSFISDYINGLIKNEK